MQSPEPKGKVGETPVVEKRPCMQSKAAHATMAIFFLAVVNVLLRASPMTTYTVTNPTSAIFPLCENLGTSKTENLTLWTMMSGDETMSEINAMKSMLRRASTNMGKPFTPWILQHPSHKMSLSARQMLMVAGWKICTLRSGFDSSKQLALRALWGMYGIERIIYLDVQSFISGDINSLATMPLKPGNKLAAAPLYDTGGWWTNQFSTSTMVINPSRRIFKKLDRKARTHRGTCFQDFMNDFYSSDDDWGNLSFRYGISTAVVIKDPEYVLYKMNQISVFSFNQAPWIACVCSVILFTQLRTQGTHSA